jgi:methylmalonyl-CoA mutase N-terminal domain/subunit
MERTSESGFPIDPVYDASKLTDFQPDAKLGRPGEYPFTRGLYPRMYVDGPWTMRQYARFRPQTARVRLTAQQPKANLIRASLQAKAGIESAACQVAREIDEGNRIVVGVNKCAADGEELYRSATHRGPTLRSVNHAMRSETSGLSITPVKCDFPHGIRYRARH